MLLAMVTAAAATSACLADATLSLQFVGSSGPFTQGQQVQVKVRMSGVPAAVPAAGFQAFLRFNTSMLSFVSGAYTNVPFGLHIINPITAVGDSIDLASGIDTFSGQAASSADADLATLTFQVQTPCGFGQVVFRPNQPPTRISDGLGQPILPIALVSLPIGGTCPGDLLHNNAVDVNDLLKVITNWGRCPPTPACCEGNANGDGVVNVNDLLVVISGWGPCP
jgi:hypothetical protein